MSTQRELKCTLDNTTHKVDSKILLRSNFLKNLMEEYKDESVIDIPDIKGSNMALIIEWLEYHKDKEPVSPPQPLSSYNLAESVGVWESEYIDKVYAKNFDSLFAFLDAVNFLDIPLLLELGCAKTASLIKDYDAAQFMELFKIEEDCTEDDLKVIEEEVRKEFEAEQEKEKLKKEEEDKLKEEEEKKKQSES